MSDYQLKSFDGDGDCIEKGFYEAERGAVEAAERQVSSPTSGIERVEMYTKCFRKHISTFNRA